MKGMIAMQISPIIGMALLVSAITAAPVAAQVIGIGTNPQGSLYYSVGAAVAKVVQEKTGIQARVQPSAGSSTYAPMIDRGELELGFVNVQDAENALKGIDNFEGKPLPNLRLVGVMFSLPIGIAVPADSPAKSIRDLKGMLMPSDFPAQSTIVAIQDAVLATGGISTKDMRRYPVQNYVKGMEALGDGKVDAALTGPGSGTSKEMDAKLSSRGGIRFISLDDTPQALAAMKAVFPGGYFDVLEPSPGMVGIAQPTRIMAYSAFLATGLKVSEEIVYKTTKTIFENKAELATSSPTLSRFDPRRMVEKHLMPYHPGAIRYYTEAGVWPPNDR